MEEKVFEMPHLQVYLSGMPELRLGLNDKVILHATVPFLKIFLALNNNYRQSLFSYWVKFLHFTTQVLFESTGRGKSKSVELEDVKFHQCVRLSRYWDGVNCNGKGISGQLSYFNIWILQVWERQNNILHSTWWRVWADVLQTQHTRQGNFFTANLLNLILCFLISSHWYGSSR